MFRAVEGCLALRRWRPVHSSGRALRLTGIGATVMLTLGPLAFGGYLFALLPRFALLEDWEPIGENTSLYKRIFYIERIEPVGVVPRLRWALHEAANFFYGRTVTGRITNVGIPAHVAATDATFRRLARAFPDSEALQIPGGQLSKNGWSQLRRFRKLKHLSVKGSNFDAAALASAPPTLVSLDASQTQLHDLAALENLSQLQTLWLHDSDVSDDGLESVTRLPKLHFVHLAGTQVTDVGLRALARCPQLMELYLQNTRITGEGLADFGSQGPLRELSLSDTSFTPAGWRHLGRLQLLTRLSLRNVPIDGQASAELGRLSGLGFLMLSACDLSDDELARLVNGSMVTDLLLTENPLTDDSLPQLAKMRLLEGINLTGTQVSGRGLRCFANSPSLAFILLGNNQLDDGVVDEIAQLRQLQELHASGLTPAERQELVALLPTLKVYEDTE
jgi:hypothetical protein